MAVDYPLPVWQKIGMGVKLNSPGETDLLDNFSYSRLAKSQMKNNNETPSNAYLFVLFIKLPSWRSNESHEGIPEMRTLRNLKNGVEAYQVKASLELTTGFPAHITTLVNSSNQRLSDDTRLVIGKNITSGTTLRLEILDAWQDIVRSAWTGDLSNLIHHLPDYNQENNETSSDFVEFISAVEKSKNERAFCGLFAASTRGNLNICKVILEKGFGPNQTTFFGNSSLHAAASNGQFEVIQLLINHDANVRAINAQKKTALDIAANSGFIDCARWLWLNQWSGGGSKKKADIASSSNQQTTAETSQNKQQYSPAKPLKECTTLFTKPPQIRLPTMDTHLQGHCTPRAVSKVGNNEKKKFKDRPKSSPLSWKVNKSEEKVSFASSDPSRSRSARVTSASVFQNRPKTAFSTSNQTEFQTHAAPVPNILPQITASLRRGRSIPSVQETRHQSHKVANLRVDVTSKSAVKPLKIDLRLNDHWINPSKDPMEAPSPIERNITPNPHNITTKSFSYIPLLNHSDDFLRDVSSKSFASLQQPSHETNNNLLDQKFSQSVNTEKLEPFEINLHRVDAVRPQIFTKEKKLGEKPKNNLISKSDENVIDVKTEVITSSKSESLKNDKPSSALVFDSYTSLHGNEKNKPLPKKTKELRFSQDEAQIFPPKPENHESLTSSANNKKLSSSKSFPPVVKNEHYEVYRKTKTDNNQANDSLSRFDLIRKERSKSAWNEWVAAKHKEKKAQKSKKKEETVKSSSSTAPVYGMTFDQWLMEKKKELERKQAIEPVDLTPIKTPQKPKHVITSGKTFNEWLREKKQEKPTDSHTNDKLNEKEKVKEDEKRRRNFAAWSAKKLEEAKREKQKMKEEEEKKKNRDKAYDSWMSKDRVMPFETWKKRKEKERKMKEKEEAEEMEKVYVDTWTAEKRREQAEKAFQKWVSKKHSNMLKKAAEELEEAKLEREEVEKKVRIRKALLNAKILLRWQRMSKRSSKLKKKRLMSDVPSLSLSTGDVIETTKADDATLRDLRALSETEDDVFQNSDAFKKAVAKMKSRNKSRSLNIQLNPLDENKETKENVEDTKLVSKVKKESQDSSTSSSSSSSSSSEIEPNEKSKEEKEKPKKKVKRKRMKKKLPKKVESDSSSSESDFEPNKVEKEEKKKIKPQIKRKKKNTPKKSDSSLNQVLPPSNSALSSRPPSSKSKSVPKQNPINDENIKDKHLKIASKKTTKENLRNKKSQGIPSSSPYAKSVSLNAKRPKKQDSFSVSTNKHEASRKISQEKIEFGANKDSTTEKVNSTPEKSFSLDETNSKIVSEKFQESIDQSSDKQNEPEEPMSRDVTDKSKISEARSSSTSESSSDTSDQDEKNINKNKPSSLALTEKINELTKDFPSESQNSPKNNNNSSEKQISESVFGENSDLVEEKRGSPVDIKVEEPKAEEENTGIIEKSRYDEKEKEENKNSNQTNAEVNKSSVTKKKSEEKENLKLGSKKQTSLEKSFFKILEENQLPIKENSAVENLTRKYRNKSQSHTRPKSSASVKPTRNQEKQDESLSKKSISNPDIFQPFGIVEELPVFNGPNSTSRRKITISMPSAIQTNDHDSDSSKIVD